jgi:tetratricopeptide (TPR) repeat protein
VTTSFQSADARAAAPHSRSPAAGAHAILRPWLAVLALSLTLGACALPAPYQPPPAPLPPPPPPVVETQPATPPATIEETQPLPEPVVREPTLGAASRALVSQAQAQLEGGNYAVAASSIERALRIEPDNPLLWIELGKLRQAEGNYVQAENMGRKAVSMAINTPRTQSSAWRLIAESYRARGRNAEAQEALDRADGLASR